MKILIAAGGTGGHIYPALAMAEAMLKRHPQAEIAFVGTPHGLENKIIPARGFALHHLPIGRLNSNVALRERLQTVLLLPWALIKSAGLLRRERPDLVLGVGGHASGPLLLMASWLRFKTAIWEPNAIPGMANRILSRFVPDCWVVFEEAKPWLRSRHVHPAGVPVRTEVENPGEIAADRDTQFHLLIFGGSQGARGINDTVAKMIRERPEWLSDVRVVHQTGAVDYRRVREAYGEFADHPHVEIKEYLHDMGRRYAWADLVVCRSGVGTLSELAAVAKPAVLIPFPFASDDHQRKNAESLVNKGAAAMIVQRDLTSGGLRATIDELRASPERLAKMTEAIHAFHRPRAAETLVEEFEERIAGHAIG